jgi:mycothiol synthase
MGTDWRAITPEDCDSWAKLLADAEQVDRTGENYDSADLAEELADPHLDPARDTAGLWLDGALIGYAKANKPGAVVDGRYKVNVEGTVAPAYRRQGYGRQIVDWVVARAAAIHAESHPEATGTVATRSVSTNADLRALLVECGFAPDRWYFTMARGLADLPAVAVPDGLRLVTFDMSYSEQTRLAHNEAFADHWGSTPRDEEAWQHWSVGQRAFRPGVSYLLLDDAEARPVVAYLLTYEWEADTAVTGRREAYVGALGTRRGWRGRGAARALLARAAAAYAEAGYDRAALDVDADNPTGALGLYTSLGFATERESVNYSRAL